MTGAPALEFSIESAEEINLTLKTAFELLEAEGRQVVMAIDEFQQIKTYPEGRMEASLRALMQEHSDLTFIFAGSKRHLLSSMFSEPSSPMFRSASLFPLHKINDSLYREFINRQFNLAGKVINSETVGDILKWSRSHTYFTQYVCHRLFSESAKNVSQMQFNRLKTRILEENEPVFFNYRNLLTKKQWNYLIAIAKEESVMEPMSAKFLRKYQLGSASTVSRNLNSLLDKDMLLREDSATGSAYSVYDLFLSRWLERL